MKKLPITKRQQVKLREMVRVLYPEYDSRLTRPIFEKDDVCFVQISLKTSTKYNEGIHWFEFCTLFLMEKLLRDGGQKEFIEYMKVCFDYTFPGWDLVQDKVHPIDYLYQKFEKLK